MTKKSRALLAAVALLLATVLALAYSARQDLASQFQRLVAGEGGWLAEEAPPLARIPHLFDLGIVDADGDGRLDIYTSNHNYRQVLLLADGKGGYRDVLTEWGLDQNLEFPGWEQSFTPPRMDQPGLYIYWLGETLTLHALRLGELEPVSGRLQMFSSIEVKKNAGFAVSKTQASVPDSPIAQTTLEFRATEDGTLELTPPSRGVPTRFELAPGFPLRHVFVGNQRVTPAEHVFTPFLRDRHGLAWADVNGDGKPDVFISRGGVGGTIRILPTAIRKDIRDELLLTDGTPRFRDAAARLGIDKQDCSGRHAHWVDADGDGTLDLFVNCQDRGRSQGIFPKQLWQRSADGHYRDIAMDIGLGLPGHEIIDFLWMDVDGDGDPDLLTSEDKGFFLYHNNAGRFTAEFLFRPEFVRADVQGLKTEVNNYWRFDGKLVATDFDSDGDLDVFSASKRGNVLLVNDAGRFRRADPRAYGLPGQSVTAVWVDYDNDGLPDLHTVPDGIIRQDEPGRFRPTGLLALPPGLYQAAIVHWFDRDNDGRRDLLLALNENPGQWRWWQRPFRTKDDTHAWMLRSWRGRERGNHWLQVEVAGPPGNPQAIGARVTVATPRGTQTQEVGISDSSFFSQGHYRLYFGLGGAERATRVNVRWGDGRSRSLENVTADRLLRVTPDTSPH